MKEYNAPIALNLVRSLRRLRVTSALLAGLLFTLAPLASAGTIGISDGKLIIGTEPQDDSQVITASIAGTNLLFWG